jgi:hypothetical protein
MPHTRFMMAELGENLMFVIGRHASCKVYDGKIGRKPQVFL